MNVIKQNPFRILGLPANATERDLQRQIGIIKRYAEIGKTKSFDYDFDFLGKFSRNLDDIQQASSKIEQAQKRLEYSLFWFINNSPIDEIALINLRELNIEKAIEIWKKTLKYEVTDKNFSSYLNLSTLYIAFSVNNGSIDMQKLQEGIVLKSKLILSESINTYSKLITGNGFAVNSDDLNRIFIDEIIYFFRPYINDNNGLSYTDFISLFFTFPEKYKKYVSSKFTQGPISDIENKIEKTTSKRKNNPQNSDKYAEELYKSSKQDISLLKNLMGSSNVQFRMLSDKVANEILQCSIDYFNDRQENDIDSNFETNLNTAIKLVKLADSIAISDQVKERAKENISTLLEMKDREISQAIALLQSVKDAYETNEAKIKQQVRIQEMSLGYGQSINWTKVNNIIRNSLDWDKVIELIHEVIPSKNIKKIKNIQNDSKLKQYKELVEFILDKMSYSNKNRVKYLAYWKAGKSSTSSRTSTSTSSGSYSGSHSLYSSNKKDLSYLPWVIGIGAGIVGAIIGGGDGGSGFVVGAIIGAIIGNVIKNNQ
jgi:hypothetical protein